VGAAIAGAAGVTNPNVLVPLCSAFTGLEAAFQGTPLQATFEALASDVCFGTFG
jgi:hypothetical protein